jgi:hypothetical protein
MMAPIQQGACHMKYVLSLFVLLSLPVFNYAADEAVPPSDPRTLNEQDIGKLTSGLAGLIAKCPGLKGKKTLAVRFANKTDEHLEGKMILAQLQNNLKKVSRITLESEKKSSADGLELQLELTSRKVQSGATHTGRYLLKGSIEKDGTETCTIESKHEKVGDVEPKKAPPPAEG